MMKTIVRKPTKTILSGAALAATALVIALLAVSYAAGPAWAQSADNAWPDPQPCGPGANAAFMEEPHEVTEGHFALFDAYWRWSDPSATTSSGVLHTNECPPEVAQTTETRGRETVEVTTRSARANGGMDIDEAIMHVLDKHKADVVGTNDEATAGQLSLQEYPRVSDFAPAGTQVWWLRLDDPDTTDVDETSDLSLGFSTLLLDDEHWHTRAEGHPMRYKFLVERYPADPANPAEVPHFFAFEAPREGNAIAQLVWDSTRPGAEKTDMLMDPGKFRALQWVFTKPGTYKLSVELQGYVRRDKPAGASENWRRVSDGDTETSEVREYVIQVGSELDETEPPIFGVNLSVTENSPGGTKVGDPIPVYNADADVLDYRLDGDGSDHFNLIPSTNPHAVQVVVEDGASLDYEIKRSYDLTLSVTDNVDHENNPDPYADDILIVRIDLEDVVPILDMSVSTTTPAVRGEVTFTFRLTDMPAGASRSTLTFNLNASDAADRTYRPPSRIVEVDRLTLTGTVSVREAGRKVTYRGQASSLTHGSHTVEINSQPVTVTWLWPDGTSP